MGNKVLRMLGVFFGVVLLILASVLIILLFTGVALGAANAWVFQGTFSEGWGAVWDRWLIALGWAILFGGTLGGSASRS